MFQLSIIIPHYNSSESLRDLLFSIPVNKVIEVIVVDDNSYPLLPNSLINDNKHVKFIKNTRGKGAGGARNTALKVASGRWLVFADADDYFVTDGINKILSAIREAKAEDIIFFVPCSTYSGTDKSASRHIKYKDLICEFLKEPSYNNNIKLLFSHYVPWSKVIKRKLVVDNEILFDETLIANDGMFSAKCSLKSKEIKCYLDCVYNVTVSEGSLTQVKNIELFRVRLEVFCRMYHYLPNNIKHIIGMSPLALIYMSRIYGIKEVFRSIKYILDNKVSFFKYLNANSIKRFYKR
ncbi:glycosyltransferase family 2 protein [Pseudoalteromonas sp. BZP1]|uniref:glycosyltransferase family 2 protein n=1 Tax=unclassified Pseudoalteromonas TaxID=194690 RepID=UPI0032C3FF11